MSQDEPTSRKDKKALRDAERHKKGKKRKADTEDHDVPAADVAEEVAAAEPTKKSKKRKADESVQEGGDNADGAATEGAKPKKRKKPRTEQAEGEGQDATKAVKSRFIVFVGNLPYKTTDDSLKAHFKKLQPFTLRHRTDPKTKKSKGFAFLEFENYDRMKTCLKLYHHSMFDPEDVKEDGADLEGGAEKQDDGNKRKKKSQARKINVELTAGGGGKTDARKDKIKAKNDRLDEQRKRRAEAERKEKEKKARKEQKHGVKGKPEKKEGQEEAATTGADASHGIHPSRLARMNG